MVILDDGVVRLGVAPLGAEMRSLRRHGAPFEYLWQGDPAIWPHRAPHLFPIVGRLRSDAFVYGGRTFRLGQHGFARDRVFAVGEATGTTATFVLQDDAATLACYPFHFRLVVAYSLDRGAVEITFQVANPGDVEMPFSIGAHPGFRCPVTEREQPGEYVLEFERAETADRFLVGEGLVSGQSEFVLRGEKVLPLAAGVFDRGALVFKDLVSRRVRLVRRTPGPGVELEFKGFPYFGVWSKPGAPFVCLEPWCGIADTPDATGHLEDKEGIVRLPPGSAFIRVLTIRPL
jgi:galactose mutarotase-like enzyme